VATPPPISPEPSARPTSTAWLAALLTASSLVLPILLDTTGRAARRPPQAPPSPRVLLLRTDADVLGAWRARELRGRTVVHAGRFLHFVDDRVRSLTSELLARPGTGRLLDDRLAAASGPRDYLAVAASLGIARRIHYVSPRRALTERLDVLAPGGVPDLPLRIDVQSFPRYLDGRLPPVGEPVLLDVNASWFDEEEGATLLEAIGAAGLRVELATLSLAEDGPDVSPGARDALRDFARRLEGVLPR
jgi:hypothetical protein